MLNHIAVILRGHTRTWKFNAELIFKFFKNISINVDYYYSTWAPCHFHESITGYFTNENLINYTILDYTPNFYNSWLGPSYLSYMILPHKNKREKEVKYDAVFDTRPDVLPFLKDILAGIAKPRPKTMYTTGFEIHHNYKLNIKDIAINDWFMMMDSETYDIMAKRFIYEDHRSSQISFKTYAYENNIAVCLLENIEALIIRPDSLALDKNAKNLYQLIKNNQNWQFLNDYEKFSILEKYNLSPFDFLTGVNKCIR